MKKQIGLQLAPENVKAGMRLIVRTYTLGGALVDILENLGTHGWRIEVVNGFLQSPSKKEKRWGPKQQVILPAHAVERFYEPAEVG